MAICTIPTRNLLLSCPKTTSLQTCFPTTTTRIRRRKPQSTPYFRLKITRALSLAFKQIGTCLGAKISSTRSNQPKTRLFLPGSQIILSNHRVPEIVCLVKSRPESQTSFPKMANKISNSRCSKQGIPPSRRDLGCFRPIKVRTTPSQCLSRCSPHSNNLPRLFSNPCSQISNPREICSKWAKIVTKPFRIRLWELLDSQLPSLVNHNRRTCF